MADGRESVQEHDPCPKHHKETQDTKENKPHCNPSLFLPKRGRQSFGARHPLSILETSFCTMISSTWTINALQVDFSLFRLSGVSPRAASLCLRNACGFDLLAHPKTVHSLVSTYS